MICQEDQYGNETLYEYDGSDNLTKVTDAYGNSYRYEYDLHSNLITIENSVGHRTFYTYDEAGIYSDAIYSKIEDALYQAKDKGTDSSKDELPNQGTVEGDVDGAPPVNAGKQGKHVKDHPNRYLPKN